MAVMFRRQVERAWTGVLSRRWGRACLALSGLALVGLLVLWLLTPLLIGWGLERFGSEQLGRQVTVGRVSFNPFRLNTRLEDLRIAGAAGKADLLTLAGLDVNVSSLSLWHRGLVLDGLRIERPVLRFARLGENRYSFSEILDRFAARAQSAPKAAPPRFSLNNIELIDGRVEFDDQPIGKLHRFDGLRLGVPFLSNLPAQIELNVTPHLEVRVNGAELKLASQLKPFATSGEVGLDIKLAKLDLTEYLGYVPVKLPAKLARGQLSSDLRLSWHEGGQQLVVSGHLGLDNFALQDANGVALLDFATLGVDITRLEPLASPLAANIQRVLIEQPALELSRSAQGILNLAQLTAPDAEKPANPETALPHLLLESLEVNKGRVHWLDQALPEGFDFALAPLSVRLQGLDLTRDKVAKLALRADGAGGETLTFDGEVNPVPGRYAGHLAIQGVKLERLRPYFQQAIGRGSVRAGLAGEADLHVATGGPTLDLRLDQLRLRGEQLAVLAPGNAKPILEIPSLTLDDGRFSLATHELDLGKIQSPAASWSLTRDAAGRINLLDALTAAPAQATAATDTTPADPWTLRLGAFECSGWNLHFEDRSGSNPVVLDLRSLGLRLADWSNASGQRASVALNTRVNKAGQLAIKGKVASQPLQGALDIDARAVDLLSVQPYVDRHFKVLVTRGALSGKGQLNFNFTDAHQPDLRFAGRLAVEGFSSLDRANDTDFVQWKHLGLENLHFQLQPLSLSARELSLDDFYTRLILDAQGRFNLRELAGDEDAAAATQSGPAADGAAPAAGERGLQLKIDQILLSGGNINYSDRFVKPNYDARLANMNGSLLGLSSEPNSLARLSLSGAVDGSAPLTVAGQLNPLRQDRFLDLDAQVKGVDLTSVSTYAAKYVGYGISKGKLSMNLKYQIRDRKLSAENQIFLDQLTFGERVESPDATKLPVLFAVSLLKNRRGEIDINLPIGGSLDDPQFSVGGIVVKLIFNLIGKAVTAPFSLIGSLFGGGEHDELSFVDFAPGKAELTPAAIATLKTLAKALDDRPALKLDITGQAEQGADMEGIMRARLDERLRTLKAERLVKKGESVGDLDALSIDADEYPQLIEAAYSAEKIADKPRNALGMEKSIPVAEMEQLLLRHFAKGAPDLQSLASQRAKHVSDWLIEEGKLNPERLFLRSSDAGENKTPAPRVLFSLK